MPGDGFLSAPVAARDKDVPVTASGLQKTAYVLLTVLIVYVWFIGG